MEVTFERCLLLTSPSVILGSSIPLMHLQTGQKPMR